MDGQKKTRARLMKETSVFEILEASACPYQIESHASTFYFYSHPLHSTVTFPLKYIKISEKYSKSFDTK